MSATEAAWIIHDVVNESMAAAIRMHVSERGGDVSRPLLTAFGGAGPVHVCNLAAKLGIRRILVPQQSRRALGARAGSGASRIRHLPARARLRCSRSEPRGAGARSRRDARGDCRQAARRCDAATPRFDVALGLGYVGQSYHVPVSVDAEGIATLTTREVLDGFAATYRAKYGYYYDDVPVELVNVHVTGTAGGDVKALVELPMSTADASSAARGERSAYSASQRRFVPFKVYSRTQLRRGHDLRRAMSHRGGRSHDRGRRRRSRGRRPLRLSRHQPRRGVSDGTPQPRHDLATTDRCRR